MSDTPITDLWLKQQIICNYEHEMVSAGFARTLERDIYKAREDRDKAISVAERLIDYAHECLVKLESWGQGYQRYEDDMDRIREDIAAYNMMKDSLK